MNGSTAGIYSDITSLLLTNDNIVLLTLFFVLFFLILNKRSHLFTYVHVYHMLSLDFAGYR